MAEICSDVDPVEEMELPLLKLVRNLWFYIALFGLAPPIQKSQASSKSSSMGRSQAFMSGIQSVSGPYLWSPEWSASVRRLSLVTPPLVSCLCYTCNDTSKL